MSYLDINLLGKKIGNNLQSYFRITSPEVKFNNVYYHLVK